MIRVYHFTSRETAQAISQHGFATDVRTSWFSPDPRTVCGEQSRSILLELNFDLSEQQLAKYRHEVQDETYDEAIRAFIAERGEPVYELPVNLVNLAMRSCRFVPSAERRELVE